VADDSVTCPALVIANPFPLALLLVEVTPFPKAVSLLPKAEVFLGAAEPNVDDGPNEEKAETGAWDPPKAGATLLPNADCVVLEPKPDLLPKPP
jgi:hypothetical protein